MWIADIRHRTGVLKDYIEIDGMHLFITVQTFARCDESILKRFHPVNNAGIVTRKSFESLNRLLQNFHRVVGGIVNSILIDRHNFAV